MLAAAAMVLPKSSICSHVKGEVHERDCPSRGGSGQAGYLGACGGCAHGGCQGAGVELLGIEVIRTPGQVDFAYKLRR